MSNWKPIDSAPKDGTRILLYLPNLKDEYCVQIGYWWENITMAYGKVTHETRKWTWGSGFPSLIKPEPEPTDWMEIPEGPKK